MKRNVFQQVFACGWWLLPAARLIAAADFGVSVTTSPSPVLLGVPLTYSIAVSNQSAQPWPSVVVTNRLPASASFVNATNSSGPVARSGQEIVFRVATLATNTTARMSVTAVPTAFGWITNSVTVAATNANGVTTNIAIEAFTSQADLGVTLTGLAPAVLVNDRTTYTLNVTNQGPGSAPNVVLSNRLPAAVAFIAVSPTNQAVFANHSLLCSLGTLPKGAQIRFNVTVQPTNAGALVISASVGAEGLLDTNSANNTVSSNMVAEGVLAGQLVATLVSTQRYNPQTGLMEQTIRLANEGTNDVPSARVAVLGLTNRLFNAVGTNNGNPFVVYANALPAGATVDLLLEIFVPARQAVTNLGLEAFAVPLVAVSPPPGTPVHIDRIVRLPSGDMLVEFSSMTNQQFTVLYCEDPGFSTNVLVAQPAVVAPADRAQWIDNGPPRTLSRPASSRTTNTARFYRVLRTP